MNRSTNRSLARLAIVGCLLGPAMASRSLAAEPSAADKSTARDFMREGKELRAAGDHAGALKKFQGAYALYPSPITAVAVGEEMIALGQLVEAREILGGVEGMPVKATETDDGRAARERAAELRTSLIPKIPVLTIVVEHGANAKLEVDGKNVALLAAEQGLRLNPGEHTAKTTSALGETQTQRVTLAEGARKKIVFTLPEGDADRSAPFPTRTIGLATAGVGVVLIGVGSVLALSARSRYKDVRDEHCPTGACDADGLAGIADARSRAGTATWVFGIGAVVAVTGVAVWLAAPDARPAETKSAIKEVRLGLSPGAFAIAGRF